MNLAELFKSIYCNEHLLFNNDKDVLEKIDKDDYWYYDFIVNEDDIEDDIEEKIKDYLYEYYYDEMPKYVHIYEVIRPDDDEDNFYARLTKTYPFEPTEEELKEISGWDYENEEDDAEE